MSKNIKNTLTIDVSLYEHYLDDSDMSDAEKNEFIQTMWNLVCEFVKVGYAVHPLHLEHETCGKEDYKSLPKRNSHSSQIESQDT